MSETDAKPFLKWAGGKRQLLEQFNKLYPQRLISGKISTYVEPFLGGGAVFFELSKRFKFKRVVLNDINKELILVYKVIQNDVEALIQKLSALQDKYLSSSESKRKEQYYKIRNQFNEEKANVDYNILNMLSVNHAAKLIFLNRTCFNGLYRLNNKGEFNVPQGKYKNPQILDQDNLRSVSKTLKGVILLCGDFEEVYPYVNPDTFVYMDPPYRPLPNTSSFTRYSKQTFNENSQIRLAEFFRKLDNKNASLMLCNSNPKNTDLNDDFFDRHYKKYGYKINEVSASRLINSNASKRGMITELVITNNK